MRIFTNLCRAVCCCWFRFVSLGGRSCRRHVYLLDLHSGLSGKQTTRLLPEQPESAGESQTWGCWVNRTNRRSQSRVSLFTTEISGRREGGDATAENIRRSDGDTARLSWWVRGSELWRWFLPQNTSRKMKKLHSTISRGRRNWCMKTH